MSNEKNGRVGAGSLLWGGASGRSADKKKTARSPVSRGLVATITGALAASLFLALGMVGQEGPGSIAHQNNLERQGVEGGLQEAATDTSVGGGCRPLDVADAPETVPRPAAQQAPARMSEPAGASIPVSEVVYLDERPTGVADGDPVMNNLMQAMRTLEGGRHE